MRFILNLGTALIIFAFPFAWAQTHDVRCTESIVLEMLPGTPNPNYVFRGVHYPAYPLDVFNRLLSSCPKTKEIDIVLDPKTSVRDVLIAYGAAEKSQFETVKFFISGPSYYYPFSIGDGTAKPMAK